MEAQPAMLARRADPEGANYPVAIDVTVSLDRVQKTWTEWGSKDPMWAVASHESKKGNKWDRAEFFESGRADVAHVLAVVQQAGVALPGQGDALDFGCGPGRLSQALAQRFDRVTGVDISEPMLAMARDNNVAGERCTFLHNTAADLRLLPDASFDFALSLMTFQHMPLPAQRAYLREVMRVLRPGGVFAFQTPERRVAHGRQRWTDKAVRLGYNLSPRWFPRMLYGLTRRGRQDMIEMHVFPRRFVDRVAGASGGRCVAHVPDDLAGHHFTSFLHIVVRP